MDEAEFQRLLQLFPVVRSRDYSEEPASSRQLASGSAQNELKEWQDAWDERDKESEKQESFWSKLKSEAASKVLLSLFRNPVCESCSFNLELSQALQTEVGDEREKGDYVIVGVEEADRFCKAFQQIHKKLVNEELSLDAARSFLNSSRV